MRKLSLCLCALAILSLLIPVICFSTGDIKKVVVSWYGVDEKRAIESASINAIQQVVGMYVVSDTVVQNFTVISDEILTHSNAFISSFQILESKKTSDGLIEIKAMVEVEAGLVSKKLGDLNIATINVSQNISTDMIAALKSKETTVESFRAMVDKLIVNPITNNNNIYDIKILSLDRIDVNDLMESKDSLCFVGNDSEAFNNGSLVPLKATVSLCLSQDYIGPIIQFFDKAAKKMYDYEVQKDGYKCIMEYSCQKLEWGKRRLGNKMFKAIRSYEFYPADADYLSKVLIKIADVRGGNPYYFAVYLIDKNGNRFKRMVFKPSTSALELNTSYANAPLSDVSGVCKLLSSSCDLEYFFVNVLLGINDSNIMFYLNKANIEVIMLLSESDIDRLGNISIGLIRGK